MQSYAGLWKEKYKGKIAIFDWYLPNMGCIAKYLGYQKPYDIGSQELAKVADKLYSLKPYVGTIPPTNSDTIQALANPQRVDLHCGNGFRFFSRNRDTPLSFPTPKRVVSPGLSPCQSQRIVRTRNWRRNTASGWSHRRFRPDWPGRMHFMRRFPIPKPPIS